MQILNEIGIQTGMQYLADMHFSHISSADTLALSTALGGFSSGVQIDEMTRAYATIANHGKFTGKTCILSIEHEKKGSIYHGDEEKEREIFNQDAAFMLTDVMQGVINESYGTCKNMDLNGQIAAVKTGTTDHVRDSWLCGYTTHYTTSVWVGNDDNTPLSSSNYAKKYLERLCK